MNLKTIFTKLCVLIILATHTQCATSQKMNNTLPIQIENPYFENWESEEKETGFTVYIPVDSTSSVKLNHIYFKGKKIILEPNTESSVYKGSYTYPKKNIDLVMSDDPKKEFKNTIPGIERIPFRLKDGECVIIYTKDGVEGHFKLDNLPEK